MVSLETEVHELRRKLRNLECKLGDVAGVSVIEEKDATLENFGTRKMPAESAASTFIRNVIGQEQARKLGILASHGIGADADVDLKDTVLRLPDERTQEAFAALVGAIVGGEFAHAKSLRAIAPCWPKLSAEVRLALTALVRGFHRRHQAALPS